MDAKSVLKDWIINFVKNKDAILRNLISIENGKGDFDIIVKYKDKEKLFMIKPVLDDLDKIMNKFSEYKHYGLVTCNTLKNFDIILKNWEKLVKFRFLCIYFVNPYSSLDKKWLIFPYTHNKICDKDSLKTGLKSMFNMVDPLTEKDIEVKFK